MYSKNLPEGGEFASFAFTPADDVSTTAEVKFAIKASDEDNGKHQIEESVKLNITGIKSDVPSETAAPTKTAKPSTGGGGGGSSTVSKATPSPAPTASPNPTEEPTEKPEATESPVKVTFKDIESHWAKESIEHLASLGYVKGFDEDTFRPEENVTRAQAVVILERLIEK